MGAKAAPVCSYAVLSFLDALLLYLSFSIPTQMFRSSLSRVWRPIASAARFSTAGRAVVSVRLPLPLLQPAAPILSSSALGQRSSFSTKAPLTKKTVEDRILLVLSCYDKVDPKKLTMDSDFAKDLGLDSLDHVEIIMAFEEEFLFEIPDGDADRLKTPRDVWQYICDKEDVYE